MQRSSPPVQYRTSLPLKAVKLEDHPGSTLRDPTGMLIEIPADVVVEIEGILAKSGLITVLWNGGAFSVFFEDLQEKAQIVDRAGA
jgi:hypothetical protein